MTNKPIKLGVFVFNFWTWKVTPLDVLLIINCVLLREFSEYQNFCVWPEDGDLRVF